MRLRAQSKSSAEHNWLATCETADWQSAPLSKRGSRSQCTTKPRALSMNRRFGVPALAGSDRLKAGHQTNLATQSGSGSQCTAKKPRRLSMNRLVAQAASLQYRRLPVGGAWNKLKVRTLRAASRLATSCVRQKFCFKHATAFSLPLLRKKEERAGERRRFLSIFPSLRLSPRSCLAGRESQKAASARRAEYNWQDACRYHPEAKAGWLFMNQKSLMA